VSFELKGGKQRERERERREYSIDRPWLSWRELFHSCWPSRPLLGADIDGEEGGEGQRAWIDEGKESRRGLPSFSRAVDPPLNEFAEKFPRSIQEYMRFWVSLERYLQDGAPLKLSSRPLSLKQQQLDSPSLLRFP